MTPRSRPFLASYGVVFTAFVFVVLVVALLEVPTFPGRARFFPVAIGTTTLVLVTIQLAFDGVHAVRERRGHPGGDERDEDLQDEDIVDIGVEAEVKQQEGLRRQILTVFGWVIGFVVLTMAIGFTFSVPIFSIAYMRAPGRRVAWLHVILVTAVTMLLVFGLFENVLDMRIPQGRFVDVRF